MGEQGKINRTEHTAGGSQNKGTEKLQRRAAPSPLEVGGKEEGKGENSAPEKPPPPTQQRGPRCPSKDFLRPDRRRALGSRREKACRTWGEATKTFGCLSRSPRREKARGARENARKPLAACAAEAAEDTHAGATESTLLWRTRKLEPNSVQGPLHVEQP